MSAFLLVFSGSQQVHECFGGFSSLYEALLQQGVFFEEALEKCFCLFEAFEVLFGIDGGEREIIGLSFKQGQNVSAPDSLALYAVEVMECLGFIRKTFE